MIPALEILKSLRLSPQAESEVQRIGSEIVAVLRDPKYDGTPRAFEVPLGEGEVQNALSYCIACALQRRFQADGWLVFLEPFAQDAFGQPHAHRLNIMIDGVALRTVTARGEAVVAPAVAPFSLRALHDELASLYGSEDVPRLQQRPKLSVIFGTYNRKALLQRAVKSIRGAAFGISYEIVVVDGGSTDGSRQWLAMQPDVLLIGEGRLEGAVAAFNQAFSLCRGEFIANFNDDAIYSTPHMLAKGVDHFRKRTDQHDTGQIAFGYGEEGAWKVSEIAPGRAYANFGITRRTVADKIARIQGGWWNPLYHTYAADVEHSAWVHRLGYKVDALPDLHVLDVLEKDGLREKNQERFASDTKRMYSRWPSASLAPDGPEPRVTAEELARYHEVSNPTASPSSSGWVSPTSGSPARGRTGDDSLTAMVEFCGLPLPEEERRLRRIAPFVRALDPVDGQFPKRAEKMSRERVLHVSLATDADPQAGLCRALKALGSDGYEQVDWTRFDQVRREREILEAAKRLTPTLVFMQLQQPGAVSVEVVRELRRISQVGAVFATWSGDVGSHCSIWGADGKSNMDALVPFERCVDISLWASMSHVRVLRAAGVHVSGFLGIGYDEEQYHSDVPGRGVVPSDWDVSFTGSRYSGNDSFSRSVPKHDGPLRDEVVAKMREAFGPRFGLFGNGWGVDVKPVPLAQAHEIYQRSRIGLSVSLLNDLEAYTSDRLFRVLGCGAALLVQRFPLMSVLGLTEENCLIFDTVAEAVEMARSYIDNLNRCESSTDRLVDGAVIAKAGAKLALERHTWSARLLEFVPYLSAVRAARAK